MPAVSPLESQREVLPAAEQGAEALTRPAFGDECVKRFPEDALHILKCGSEL